MLCLHINEVNLPFINTCLGLLSSLLVGLGYTNRSVDISRGVSDTLHHQAASGSFFLYFFVLFYVSVFLSLVPVPASVVRDSQ